MFAKRDMLFFKSLLLRGENKYHCAINECKSADSYFLSQLPSIYAKNIFFVLLSNIIIQFEVNSSHSSHVSLYKGIRK